MADNMFYCSNNQCDYRTMQSKTKIAQELGDYKLCQDCARRGFYLDNGVVVKKLPATTKKEGANAV